MSRGLTAPLAACALALAVATSVAGSNEPAAAQSAVTDEPKTLADSIYTTVQAGRGQVKYDETCASCHLQDLSGSNQAPSLAGPEFLDRWNGRSVDELVERIRTSMPADRIGSLTREDATDLVAYMTQASDFPSGQQELKADRAVLRSVVIRGK